MGVACRIFMVEKVLDRESVDLVIDLRPLRN